MSSDPVNRITRGDTSVSECRVFIRPLFCVIPPKASLCMDVIELWQSADVRAPAEIIDDEALHASGFSSVNQSDLMYDAGRANNANCGILARHSFGQLIVRILGFDDGYSGWESCHGMNPANYSDLKPGSHERSCDGCPKIARGRRGCQ